MIIVTFYLVVYSVSTSRCSFWNRLFIRFIIRFFSSSTKCVYECSITCYACTYKLLCSACVCKTERRRLSAYLRVSLKNFKCPVCCCDGIVWSQSSIIKYICKCIVWLTNICLRANYIISCTLACYKSITCYWYAVLSKYSTVVHSACRVSTHNYKTLFYSEYRCTTSAYIICSFWNYCLNLVDTCIRRCYCCIGVRWSQSIGYDSVFLAICSFDSRSTYC